LKKSSLSTRGSFLIPVLDGLNQTLAAQCFMPYKRNPEPPSREKLSTSCPQLPGAKPKSCWPCSYTTAQDRAAKASQAFFPAFFCQAAKSFNTITHGYITFAKRTYLEAIKGMPEQTGDWVKW
jgi:hypothetical protein